MHYALVDDSVPFDGFTSQHRPLGGAEKALANLAAALATRGHKVTVVNKTPNSAIVDGVTYTPIDDMAGRPLEADVVIASRQPKLLGAVRKVRHRLLWVTASPDYLTTKANAPLWDSFKPTVLFVSDQQRYAYSGALPHHVIAPGVGAAYYDPKKGAYPVYPEPEVPADAPPPEPAKPPPPHAVVTTHPLHGLVWLTEIWRRLIHPNMPEARLSVYSAVLTKGLRGDAIPDNIQPILERVKLGADANIVVVDPRGDYGMAEVYRTSRIHFYPGDPEDYACWTLAESQGAGTPAVARSIGGVEERVGNGQTGYLIQDAAAIASVALQILRDDTIYGNLNSAAVDITRRRTWEMVAAEIDAIVEKIPAA